MRNQEYLFKTSSVDRTRLRTVLKSILPGQEEDVMLTIEQEIIAEVRPGFLAEGKADTLLRQLLRRNKTLPTGIEKCVRAAGINQLDEWSERFADGLSLSEIFGPDQTH